MTGYDVVLDTSLVSTGVFVGIRIYSTTDVRSPFHFFHDPKESHNIVSLSVANVTLGTGLVFLVTGAHQHGWPMLLVPVSTLLGYLLLAKTVKNLERSRSHSEHNNLLAAVQYELDHLYPSDRIPVASSVTACLERLTKPGLDKLPAHQGTSDVQESPMDVRLSFIAHLQPSVSVQPGVGPFHDPPIASQPLRALDPPSGAPRCDPPLPHCLSHLDGIRGLIGMQRLGPLAGPAASTTHLLREPLPGNARHQPKHYPRQSLPIRDGRSSPCRRGLGGRKDWKICSEGERGSLKKRSQKLRKGGCYERREQETPVVVDIPHQQCIADLFLSICPNDSAYAHLF